MELEDAAYEQAAEPEAAPREQPRAADWLWRPWYAKVWWALIAMYWGVRLVSLYVPALEALYDNALAGYLNIAFFPSTLLLLLGIGFVGDCMDYYRWEWVVTPELGLHPRRSVGGFIDPYTDPLDPRSGAKYWRHLQGKS